MKSSFFRGNSTLSLQLQSKIPTQVGIYVAIRNTAGRRAVCTDLGDHVERVAAIELTAPWAPRTIEQMCDHTLLDNHLRPLPLPEHSMLAICEKQNQESNRSQTE